MSSTASVVIGQAIVGLRWVAAYCIARIQQLYRIERETKSLSADERQRIRQTRAAPLLDEIRAWLDEQLPIDNNLIESILFNHR